MGGVDDTMSFVKSWSDWLQATSIRCMHASSRRSGLMLSFVKSWSDWLQTKTHTMHAYTDRLYSRFYLNGIFKQCRAVVRIAIGQRYDIQNQYHLERIYCTRMWAASLEKAKQITSASARLRHPKLLVAGAGFSLCIARPHMYCFEVGSLLASLSRLTHIL